MSQSENPKSQHDAMLTAVTVLVVACPSALLLSSPSALLAAFAAAARLGIMIKQPNYLEAAGNVTANFSHAPGQPKKRTTIGSNVRTGVDNTFLAPVEIGDDTWIAPGTVITENVPPGSLAGFAPRQVTKEGWVYEKHGNPDDD